MWYNVNWKGRCSIRNQKEPPPIPPDTLRKIRTTIRTATWKQASSPQYRDAPHSYLIWFGHTTVWKWFAAKIRKHGTYRTWRGHKYKYLLLDGDAFWIDWPALNKARADTLDGE